MTLYTALSRNDLLNHLMQVVPGDTIQVAADVKIDEFVVPKNIAASVANPVTIRSANISRPAVLRGIGIGRIGYKGNFTHLSSAPSASSVIGLALDGVVVEAQLYTSCKDENGATRSLIMPDGRGLGWRVTGTAHPSGGLTGYSENGASAGVRIGSGVKGFRGKNITFRHHALSFVVGSAEDTDLRWCGFYECAEDHLKFSGFNGLTMEWNEARDARSPKAAMAAYQGWGNSEDVHMDYFQQTGPGKDLILRYNYLHNDNGRVHFALIRHSQQSDGFTKNVTIENCESRQTHPTGMLVSSCDGLLMRRNKITGIAPLTGGGPVIRAEPTDQPPGKWGPGEYANKGTRVFEGNECTRLQGQVDTGSNGNAKNNNPDHYPTGFTQIQKGKVGVGAYSVGPYGGETDVVVMPTKPTALSNPIDAIMADDPVQDPDLAVDDPRRTGVIKIRKHGLAGNASAVRWQTDDDTASRGTVEIEGDATHRYFRMFSNNGSHLLLPGDPAKVFKVLYVDPAISSTARSDLSSFDLTFSVPVAPGGAVWLPTNKIVFPLTKGLYAGGRTLKEAAIRGRRWHKPAPKITGYGLSTDRTLPQPATPAAYAAGAFLLGGAYRSSTGAFVIPTEALWTEILALSGSNNQAFSLLRGVAPSPAAALGAYTAANGRTFAVAFDKVDLTDPIADIQSSYHGTQASIPIPALTLPETEDNFRGVIIACNPTGQAMTPPDGYQLVGQHGGSPRVAIYQSIDPIGAFPATTVALAAGAQCVGVSLALRLVANL